MKKFIVSILVLLCIIAGFCTPLTATAETESSNYSGVYGQIDEYLGSAFKAARIPSASVVIVDKDSVQFDRAYGNCPDTQTPFLLGSVSKSFTALCIMKLCEDGMIDLNANISTYLPDARYGKEITVIQLLNHSAGIDTYQTLKNYKVGKNRGKHVYANVNYTLLGQIIESVSGVSYEEYVEQNIFEPLKMTKSAASLQKAEANGLITGYENFFGFNVSKKPQYPKDYNDWITVPAGYLSSSATDLGKYLQSYITSLNGEKVIVSQEGVNQMFTDGVDVGGEIPYRYCMGWNRIREPLEETVLRHSGLVETGMSCIYVLPERGLGVAVLINTNDFLVAQNMMDSIDWSVTLMLLSMQPNSIANWEYPLYHFLYDMLFIIIFAIAVLPLALLKVHIKRLPRGKRWVKICALIALHAVLPTLILLFPIIFVSTPLWVVNAFVPDLFAVLAISSLLLYAGGVVKSALWIYLKKRS
ncbi:MAG: beta-lactamase family protein [Clostridia bacterium]|nr:beta-lactamase family protein [Clostridia bacterium]